MATWKLFRPRLGRPASERRTTTSCPGLHVDHRARRLQQREGHHCARDRAAAAPPRRISRHAARCDRSQETRRRPDLHRRGSVRQLAPGDLGRHPMGARRGRTVRTGAAPRRAQRPRARWLCAARRHGGSGQFARGCTRPGARSSSRSSPSTSAPRSGRRSRRPWTRTIPTRATRVSSAADDAAARGTGALDLQRRGRSVKGYALCHPGNPPRSLFL